MFGAKSVEEFLTSPLYAPVRRAMMAKRDVIERLAKAKQVGGPMEDEEDRNVADEDAADEAAAGAYANLGGLSAMSLKTPEDFSRAILANSQEQKRYYDDLANQIRERRYGPSETEKLLALSSAFFAPTSVRGFSGTMGNVLPVLQKFGELKRTGEEERTEALQNLAKQRMALAQGDVKTALDLQRLLATYNKKPTGAKPRAVVGGDQRLRHSVFGTEITPPNQADLSAGRAFMSNPDVSEERKAEFRRQWNDTYGVDTDKIYLVEGE
jgi:hypothetical protein